MFAQRRSVGFLVRLAGGAVLLASAVLSASAAAPPAASPGAPGEPGVWTKHQYNFRFMGFTSTYSCDGLADKLKTLVIAAGARKDAKAVAECTRDWGRPDKFAAAELTFYTLVPASDPKAGRGEAGLGAWRSVEFAPNLPRTLQAGDCELIEQFRDSVLPMFTIRNRQDATTCIPHQLSGSNFDLKFDTFAPAAGSPGVVAAPPAAAAGPPVIFAYPAKGQSAAQQSQDRSECSVAATGSSGYDPAQPAAAAGPDGAARRGQFEALMRSCLEGRGYSVK